MDVRLPLSRRRFFGGAATFMAALGLRPSAADLFAQGQTQQFRGTDADYDSLRQAGEQREQLRSARVGHESDERRVEVCQSLRLSGRQRRPGDCRTPRREAREHPADPGLRRSAERDRHDVPAGRQEGRRRRPDLRAPSSSTPSNIKAEGIKVPLLKDYRQDIPTMIARANENASSVGLFYLCNPNNPTGRIVSTARSQAGYRGHPEDDADPHRRGLSPLRGRPVLRNLGAVHASKAVR